MSADPPPAPDENAQQEWDDFAGKPLVPEPGEGGLWDLEKPPPKPRAPAPKDSQPQPLVVGETPRTDTNPAVSIPSEPRDKRRANKPFNQPATEQKPKSIESLLSKPGEKPVKRTATDVKSPVADPRPVPPRPERTRVEDTFDDLESGDDTPVKLKEIMALIPAALPESRKSAASDPVEIAQDPEAPKIAPPRAGISSLERIGLISFLVLLLAGVIFFLALSVYRLPEKRTHLTNGDFPIAGERVQAVKIESYWRAPISEGENADAFRRGTALLPVVEFDVAGGPGAVRIFFRNSDGQLVGDGETRAVNGAATLKIAATAGFEDLGMHAAYRTGNTEPWIVEVFEGNSVDAPGRDFKKLFDIPISVDRR